VNILLTNDDGVGARGLRELRRALAPLGSVTVVAPDRERSSTSHSLTLRQPLRVCRVEEGVSSVDGTPTDCVLLAVHDLLDRPPDLLVSGINHGPNLGDDVTYSGTVAAAFEGTLLGIPSVAISLVLDGPGCQDAPGRFDGAAGFARRLARQVGREGLPPGTLLNVNVPDLPAAELAGFRWTRLGKRVYENVVSRGRDARGEVYFEIGGDLTWREEEGTDFAALAEGFISVTPVHLDLTDYQALGLMRSWDLSGGG